MLVCSRAEKSLAEREEIQRLAEFFVSNYQSEDPDLKDQAWEIGVELYNRFLPLIKAILFGSINKIRVDPTVWATTINREGEEDMLSEAKVQFFEALTQYDPGGGVWFVHYIKTKLQFGIFNYLRNNQCFDHSIQTQDSLDLIMSQDFEDMPNKNGLRLYSKHLMDHSENLEEKILEEPSYSALGNALRVAWNSLTEKQKKVVELVIFKNYTLREASRELGHHFTTIRGIKNSALRKMEKILKKFI